MLTAIQTGFTMHGPYTRTPGLVHTQPLKPCATVAIIAWSPGLESCRPFASDLRITMNAVPAAKLSRNVELPEYTFRKSPPVRLPDWSSEKKSPAPAGSVPSTSPEAIVVLGEAVVRLPVERVAHQRLCVAVAVLVLVVGRRVRHERSFAHDPQRLVEVALVPASRHLAVHRHGGVRVHLRQHLVVNRIRDQRHAGEHGPTEAPHAGRVVLDPDALRHRDDAAVIALHPVREAPVRRVIVLVALGWHRRPGSGPDPSRRGRRTGTPAS